MLMQLNIIAGKVFLTARINPGTSQVTKALWRQEGLKRSLS